ncbi:phosphatase PAP2 family protein [Bacillus sp. DX1.1]|uniref:phosphatase PAP2 family protein n=1 Tax=unclassified Bacillus (in: firmicutes) TaxID=185979 RepID=UPI00256FB782|nr:MULTISPECIES: phosphatase PAP2 family protein [unclassified Bacillus (in: firmicutes)]MDM5154853.1 phosphatase PAP2 family protein [Bacillus sp. DX1.1]WJE83727.1 phosphatase PAP2 family protein [Bacillus sp. DX3.1]
MKRYRHLYMLSCTLLICFVVLSLSYHTACIEKFDNVISEFIQSFRNDYLTSYFVWMSYIGSEKIYFPLLLIVAMYFLIRTKLLSAVFLLINYYGSRYLNSMLKLWYERPRPDVSQLVTATGYSFPSGHTMNATAFLGFIAYVTITEHRISLHKKLLLIFITCFIISSISVSRVYLGVHHPSDILAGWAAGGSWLILCIIFHRAFIKKEPMSS